MLRIETAPDEFASAIRTLFDQNHLDLLRPSEDQAMKAQAAKMFSQVDLSNTELSYQTIEMLHFPGRFELSQDAKDKLRTDLLARQDNWQGQPYAEVRAKVMLMIRLDIDDKYKIAEARRWILAGGTKDQVPEADLQSDLVRQVFSDLQIVSGSFTATWTGFITAPQNGNYVFSVSPINVNSTSPSAPISFDMTASVNGQATLNSTSPDKSEIWTSESAPVTLVGGQPVPISVTAKTTTPKLKDGLLHAVLFWQGPGLTKSVVPASSFTQTNAGRAGLQATYSWTDDGVAKSLKRVDPNIDFAWTSAPLLLSQDMSAANQASDTMWKAQTSTAFVKAYLATPLRKHSFLQ